MGRGHFTCINKGMQNCGMTLQTHQYLVSYLCCLSKKIFMHSHQGLIIKLKQIPNLSFFIHCPCNILDLFIFQNKQPDNIGLVFQNNFIYATNVFFLSQISYCILIFNREQETTVQERSYREINKGPPYWDYYFNNTLSKTVGILSYSFRTLFFLTKVETLLSEGLSQVVPDRPAPGRWRRQRGGQSKVTHPQTLDGQGLVMSETPEPRGGCGWSCRGSGQTDRRIYMRILASSRQIASNSPREVFAEFPLTMKVLVSRRQ